MGSERVVVKASGQAFAGPTGSGIDRDAVGRFADQADDILTVTTLEPLGTGLRMRDRSTADRPLRSSSRSLRRVDRSSRRGSRSRSGLRGGVCRGPQP